MKNVTKVLLGLVGSLTLFLQSDLGQQIVGGLIASHPKIAAAIAGISGILALVHVPSKV
jgi:hypothetical protein